MKTKNAALCHRLVCRPYFSLPLVMAVVCLLNPGAGRAADGVWSSTVSGGLWSSAANWSGGVVADGSGAFADFGALNITANTTVLFDAPHTLCSLRFADTGPTVFNWILSNNGTAANVLTLAGPSPSITVSNGTCTCNLVIDGTSGFSVNGSSTAVSALVLGAANTFTGNLTLNAGGGAAGSLLNLNLYANNAGALGGSAAAPNTVVLVGSLTRADLYLNTSGATYPAYNSLIMRPAAANSASRAELHSAAGNATWNGNIILDGVSGSASPRCDFYGDVGSSTFTLNGNLTTINDFIGQMSFRGLNSGNGIINGNINVPGAVFTKDDLGTWLINSVNNLWTTTVVATGTLKLGADNALPVGAGLTMGGGSALAILELNGFQQTVASMVATGSNTKRITNSTGSAVLTVNNATDVTYAGALGGSLSLNKSNTGTLTLSGVCLYTGNTVINGGTLAVASTGSLPGSTNIIVAAGATFAPSGLTLSASQKFCPADGTANLGGTLNVGTGSVVLNYGVGTPALNISNGNLVLSSSSVVVVNVTGSLVSGETYPLVSLAGTGQVSGIMPSTVTLNGGGGVAASLIVANGVLYLVMDTKPLITSQTPVSYTTDSTLFVGASPTLSVTVGGLPPFGYKWYTNGVLNAAATGATMSWTNLRLGSVSAYCVVTNASGSATSATWSATVVAAPTTPYPLAVMSNSLVGYWRLNEPDNGLGNYNAGEVAHDYWGGNNGVFNNVFLGQQPGYSQTTDPTTTTAMFGAANPTDCAARGIAGVDFASPANTSKAFSVEAWVAGWAMVMDSGIVAKGYGSGGEQFDLDSSTTSHAFRFLVRDAAGTAHVASSTIVPKDSVWHHLVGVCDEPNGVVTLYVDGQSVATATIGTNAGILSSTSLMSIGARYSSATAAANNTLDTQFFGFINDVAVYNAALTASQVQNHYFSAGLPPVIFRQPPAGTNVNQNGTLTVSVVANGTKPLFFSWFDVNAGSYIDGQTNATLVLTNFQTANSYYLTVTNAYGSTNSSTIAVTPVPGFTVSMVPAVSSLNLYAGLAVNFAVTASGTEPFYYRWLTNGVAVAGATGSSYVATMPLGSTSVSCQVSNSFNGLSSLTLGPVNLTGVNAATNMYQATILSNSPVAYWTLSEPANFLNNGNAGATAYDYVGGHNGTYANVNLGLAGFDPVNASWLTSAQFGVFTPSNSVVTETDRSGSGLPNLDFARPSGSDAQFSVEAWVNSSNNANGIVSKGNGHSEQFSLDMVNSGFRFVFRDAAGTAHDTGTSPAPTVGQWYHVVGVWDGASGAARLFVNGVNVRSLTGLATGLGLWTPANNASLPGASLVHFGALTSSTATNVYDLQFQGKIAHVALYNYALNTNQVVAHYYSATNLPAVVTPGTLIAKDFGHGQLQLIWNFSGVLQSATNVAGPYSTEVGVASPYTVQATNAFKFYRIKQQ